MLTNRFLYQQMMAFEMMQEVNRRAMKQGIVVSHIHDSVVCSAEDEQAIDKILKEVQHDFGRSKALVKTS